MSATASDDDKLWRALRAQLAALAKTTITVGVHGDERERDGGDLDNVQIATIHEFGAPAAGIPARSFLRAAVDGNLLQLRQVGGELAARVGAGELKAQQAAAQLGAFTVGLIDARMAQGIDPPLRAATLAKRARKFAKGRRALKTIARDLKRKKLSVKGAQRVARAFAVLANAKPLIDTGQLRQSIAFKVHR